MDISSNQIVNQTLSFLSVQPPKFIVDVGASEGQYNSCSFGLIHDFNWSGVLIEPMPKQFQQLQQLYINRHDIICVNAALTDHDGESEIHLHPNDGNGLITANHGSSLLKPHGSNISLLVTAISFQSFYKLLPDEIGLLTIDTEGYDFTIIEGLLKCGIRPYAIISENFSEIRDDKKHALLDVYDYRCVIDNRYDTGWILKGK